MSTRKPRSIRQLLALLAVVFVLPVLALVLLLGAVQVREAQQRLEVEARADAHELLRRVDALLEGRLAALRRAAAAIAAGRDADATIAALRAETGCHVARIDAAGTLLADTRPAELPLPPAARAAGLNLEAEGRVVSPLVADPASGGHALLLAERLPGGRLLLALPAAQFLALLRQEYAGRFDPTRFPAVVDAEGRIVARWQDHARHVGTTMPAAALAALRAAPAGSWSGPALDGRRVLVIHATSPLSGLAIGMGITAEALARPYWQAAAVLVPVALLFLGFAALATRLVTRRIGGPVASLGAAAAALAEGRPPPRLVTPLIEANAVAAAMADAAERRRLAEAQRDLLVRELHHRVKNLLATAQSLATLSARSATDPAGFAEQFGDRLRALARTHTLLLEQPGGEIELAALLREVLAPYRMGLGRIAFGGPALPLPAETAVPLGMVLHELATNAAKYGALSVPEGRLDIAWRIEEASPSVIVLDWTEREGPPVRGPPTRAGFGSELLRRALAGLPEGRVEQAWRPEGLAVHITCGQRRRATS